MARGRIILDGTIAAPESRKGEPFAATLQPRQDALYGTTGVLYRGGKVGTIIIELGRRSSPPRRRTSRRRGSTMISDVRPSSTSVIRASRRLTASATASLGRSRNALSPSRRSRCP